MSEVADVLTALGGTGGVLVTVGAGIRWVWLKFDGRIKAVEDALEECRKREDESRERRSIQLTVIELLWQRIQEVDPNAAVLVRAKKLLDDLKAKANAVTEGRN